MGAFHVMPTGRQTATSMREIDELIKSIREDPRQGNPRVLGINMLATVTAKNRGYPKWMYHATFEPRMVMKEEEEEALQTQGYKAQYIHRAYPKVMYRRNFSDRFALRIDPASKQALNIEYCEQKNVGSKEEEEALLDAPTQRNCGPWVADFEALEPLAQGKDEPVAVKIARLETECAMQRAQLDQKAKKN